jgi:proline iminopeptidase
MADDIASLCDPLGVVSPVTFGHSAGGFVALHLALRQPGLASGLILCDTAPTLAPVPDDNPPPSLMRRTNSTEALAVASKLFGGYFFEAQAPTYDFRARLTEIEVPALVIVGAYDWICPPVGSRLLAARLPNAELVEIAGAGHFVYCEEPERFQEVASTFLDQIAANRRMAGRQSQRSKRPVSTS